MKLFFKWLLNITNHQVIGAIVVLVLIALYGAITKKLGEWLGYIWIAITLAFDFVLSIFTYEVAIWEIIVFFVVAVGALILYVKWTDTKTSIAEGMLTELEKQILRMYDSDYNYGRRLDIMEIARELRNNDMLSIEQAVVTLEYSMNYLQRHDSFGKGTTFTLSGNGRNYILQNLR